MNNSINTPEQPCNKISYNQFQFDFYTEISREKMYEIVLENEAKITRVSPELFKDLIQFNNRRQSRNHTGRLFVPDLSSYKKAQKYKGRKNDYLLELDRIKYLKELGYYSEGNESIKDTLVIVSQKGGRILGIAYRIRIGNTDKLRFYIRYSTLVEKRIKAECIIRMVSERYDSIFHPKK